MTDRAHPSRQLRQAMLALSGALMLGLVVIAMSATATSRDHRVGGLVRVQPTVHVADQATNRERMPMRDDFVVTPGRN